MATSPHTTTTYPSLSTMKITAAALLLCLCASEAFVPPSGKAAFSTRTKSLRKMAASPEDEVAALRAAAAKAREDAARLSAELGKTIPQANTVVKKVAMSVEDVMAKTNEINFGSSDAVSQTMQLDDLTASGDLSLWKSAGDESGLRTFPVSLGFLESRTNGKVTGESLGLSGEGDVSLDDFKYATLGVTLGSSVLGVASLALLPENVGATACYVFAIIPILFLGVGSTAPALIANVIVSAKGSSDDDESRLDRICRHESAHFLTGYLCGLPVKSYSLNDDGVPCVEFHSSADGDATSREFSSEEVAALSVVAMSGSVGEVLEFGNAKGGENDLIELERIYSRSAEFVGAAKQQDLTRWGALTSYQLLTENRERFDALVGAFKNKKSVSECVAILELCCT